ncbi:hypothetical protein MTO96_046688 [Rhipicephalus appendiculatus]
MNGPTPGTSTVVMRPGIGSAVQHHRLLFAHLAVATQGEVRQGGLLFDPVWSPEAFVTLWRASSGSRRQAGPRHPKAGTTSRCNAHPVGTFDDCFRAGIPSAR